MANVHKWDLIQSNKNNGTAKLKCPVCTPTRKNKTDRSLFVNFNNGTAKCFNDGCNALFFRDSIEKGIAQNNYTLPVQTWKNYTKLSDKLVKWCEETRKIKQYTLNNFQITEEKYYQPATQKEENNIVFNYFEGDVLVNKKYRSGSKKFTQSKNGKPIFYNINSIIGQEECYIVEGEFDVLALYEIGIKNVISVPNGANDNDNYWLNSEKYLKDIKRFYIATDNDESGNNVAEKIAQRLGRWRCQRVLFFGKDANEDLINGDLEKSIYNVKKYPVSGTFSVSDLYDNILELYDKGLPDTLYPKQNWFGRLKENYSVMRGHLITGTGIPSHGKSNFTEWYVLNLLFDYNLKVSFFSPEHSPMALHQSTFIQKVTGRSFWKDYDNLPRITKEEIAKYHDWANEKIYLTSPDNGEVANWDWLLDKFKEQMVNFGIDIFVIDAFNKVELTGKDTLKEISRVLTKLTAFAQANNVIIFLIAHPTKMKKNEAGIYDTPSLYDVSGSADFRNQTHDGFCVYRYFANESGQEDFTRIINLKTKFSFQGNIGEFEDFNYHIPSGRYYAKGTEAPTFNLIDFFNKKQEVEEAKFAQELTPFPIINPVDAFGEPYNEKDDVPF